MSSGQYWKPGDPKPAPKANAVDVKAFKSDNSKTAGAATLSKSVMNMKFMKARQTVAPPTQALSDLQSSVISSAISSEDIDSTPKPTATYLAQLNESLPSSSAVIPDRVVQYVFNGDDPYSALPGRRSFNNCNPAIAKFYQRALEELNYKGFSSSSTSSTGTGSKEKRSIETDIDIAKYDNLVGLPRGPNQSKKIVEPKKAFGNKASSGSSTEHSRKQGSQMKQDASLSSHREQLNHNRHVPKTSSNNSPSNTSDRFNGSNTMKKSVVSSVSSFNSKQKQSHSTVDKYPMKKLKS